MSTSVDQIKERLSIVDVVSTYTKLERSGINYRARCPFHNEKTPSFFVSPARGSYYCFGCGVKGDIFSFVQTFEGLDFKGALKILADRAGVTLTNVKSENTDEKEKLFAVMETATSFYEEQLSKNPASLKYLKDRGLSDATIALFRIGFAPDDWRPLSSVLVKQKISEAILEKAGLIKRTEKGVYDRFRNRVMFPIFDSTGRVIAFSGRTLVVDDTTPKYLNSPDTPLFDKSSALYGIDRAKEWIRKKDYAILVEGQFDLLLSHQAGITNTVAASGTALSDIAPSGDRGVTNLQMLARLSKNVLFAFDGDKAGINATYRGALLALGLAMDVKVARLPESKDPADIIKESPEKWLGILKDTEHAIPFFANRVMTMSTDARERIKLTIKLVLPLIATIKSALDQEHFLKNVHEISGASLDALRTDLAGLKEDTRVLPLVEVVDEKKNEKRFSLGERLYGVLFWLEGMATPMIDPKLLETRLREVLGDDRTLAVRDAATEHKDELIFEAEASYEKNESIKNEVEHLLTQLHMRELKRNLENLAHEISSGEREGKDMNHLLEAVKEKTKLLNSLESKPHDT